MTVIREIVWSIQMLLMEDLSGKYPLIEVDISKSIDIWIHCNTNGNIEHLLESFLILQRTIFQLRTNHSHNQTTGRSTP